VKTKFLKTFKNDLLKIKSRDILERVEKLIIAVEKAADLRELKAIPKTGKLKGHKIYYKTKIKEYRAGMKVKNSIVEFMRFLHRKDIYRRFP
jgi:mRNA interferase RelE/StbE|tara:strand:- start:361 stop:636 length:276 start_codon:yes stop_codon:yes gene_type:complete